MDLPFIVRTYTSSSKKRMILPLHLPGLYGGGCTLKAMVTQKVSCCDYLMSMFLCAVSCERYSVNMTQSFFEGSNTLEFSPFPEVENLLCKSLSLFIIWQTPSCPIGTKWFTHHKENTRSLAHTVHNANMLIDLQF